MKYLALIWVMSLAHPWADYDQNQHVEVRKGFVSAAENTGQRLEFLESLEDLRTNDDAFKSAYLGAAKTLYAECEFTPWSKYTYFKDGTKLLEAAIKKQPENVEFRYLRFLIQSQSPSFLNYNDQLETDFEMISQYISAGNKTSSWVNYFVTFLEERLKDENFQISVASQS